MPAALHRGAPPPRTPERQHLAEAIRAHAAALDRQRHVSEALGRIGDELYQARSTVTAARRAVNEARQMAPEFLIDPELRNETVVGTVTVAQSQTMLAEAEARVEVSLQARQMLHREAEKADAAVHMADQELTAAVAAVVASEKRAIEAEFRRAARRVLQMQKILMTLHHGVVVFSAEDIGLHLRIGDVTNPATGSSRFVPDGAWRMAVAALREDADNPLPDLPPPEPDDAADGAPAEAA